MDTAHLFRGDFGKYMVAAPEKELLSVCSSAVSKRGAGVPRISTRAGCRGAQRHTSTHSQAKPVEESLGLSPCIPNSQPDKKE